MSSLLDQVFPPAENLNYPKSLRWKTHAFRHCAAYVMLIMYIFYADIDRLVYILSSVSVVLILACLLYLVWRQHRRRASFHVQSSTVVANELVKPSYRKDNARQVSGHERNGVSLNNNIAVKTDFTSYPSSEIVLNPMLLQPSQNSRR